MPWDEMDNWMRNDKVPLDAYRLLEVYEAAQSVDASDLKSKAKELYPDRFTAQEPEIYVHQSSGRGFWHNGECVQGAIHHLRQQAQRNRGHAGRHGLYILTARRQVLADSLLSKKLVEVRAGSGREFKSVLLRNI